ncbi:hypothetical protein [Nonomuraea africana]|uniref:Alpha amylase inhibitor n=1 Tax=Nonomuraea africana TaxID=46171 RepID=A0ABR9KG33_9ACTN|nr:hypothetical protein [Nonomuraea africana]MBE1560972.1 hypothetical protein [Nonomuraea africana]
MRTALRTAALTVTGLAVSLLALPGQAGASAAAIPAGNAPTCVTVWEHTGRITKTGYARNDCRYTLNLKIVWARGTDGPCRTVRPGETISTQVPRGIRSFDGADRC